MPKRIQRKRIKGWRLSENAKCVDRSTRWGNPFKIGDRIFSPIKEKYITLTLSGALDHFELWLKKKIEIDSDFLEPLRGKDLACFCKEGEPCHADILLRYANEEK